MKAVNTMADIKEECGVFGLFAENTTDEYGNDCLSNWLNGAGTEAGSRKLTLANEGIYNALSGESNYLPDIWKSGQAEIIYK